MIIRPLTVFEREAVRKFYLSLSPDDRRKRFCCTLSDDTISSYVDRVDFTRDTILGAFDEQAKIIGLAELVRGTAASEMAFSVRPDRRGQKIGTRLIQRLMLHARICGIAKAEGILFTYVGNVPGHAAESTYCPGCGKRIIHRSGFNVQIEALQSGKCAHCGKSIPGRWETVRT